MAGGRDRTDRSRGSNDGAVRCGCRVALTDMTGLH